VDYCSFPWQSHLSFVAKEVKSSYPLQSGAEYIAKNRHITGGFCDYLTRKLLEQFYRPAEQTELIFILGNEIFNACLLLIQNLDLRLQLGFVLVVLRFID